MSAWLRGSKMNRISEYYNNSLRGNKRIVSRQHPHAVRPEGWCCQMTPTFLPDNELIKGITSCLRLASTSTTCKSPQQCLHNGRANTLSTVLQYFILLCHLYRSLASRNHINGLCEEMVCAFVEWRVCACERIKVRVCAWEKV